MTSRCLKRCRRKLLALAVASCFAAELAHGNPTGPTVVRGQASFATQGNTLTVTNTPGTAINWQSFSIPSQEITRFLQQSAASAVLNRVTGSTPSSILGQMQSNGRVYLINPNGITIGAGAVIDVAGFVASSLNLSDADFAAGRLRFTETPGAGAVVNRGEIKTSSGGMVYLVGQSVENHGVIKTPEGEIVLAAGKSIELVDAGTPEIRVQITAPDNEALNLGQLLASGGRIGMYAGLVRHGGTANANTAVVGENGKIVFKATRNVTLEAGSVTTASGPTAGSIKIEAETGTAVVAGVVEANATAGHGGSIEISGQQGVTLESTGRLSANGVDGGAVALSSTAGPVRVAGQIRVDASAGRGGQVAIAAATLTSIATSARVTANSTQGGGSVSVAGNESVLLETGSFVQANGAAGGVVTVEAAQGLVEINGTIEATGGAADGGIIRIAALTSVTLGDSGVLSVLGNHGGEVRVEAWDGTTLVSGLINAFGGDGQGGKVLLLGSRVGLIRNARVNVSGQRGGGVALVGGDFQGGNPDIQNAERTYVGADARITANAIETGDGGKVIVWADGDTRYYGTITARGGAHSGNGGFVEVSGKEILNFYGKIDVSAPAGRAGTILLDPRDIIVEDTPGPDNGQIADGTILSAEGTASTDYTISDDALELLNGNIILQATRDITIEAGLSGGGLVLTNQTGGERVVLQAGRHVTVGSPLITNGAAIWLSADSPHANGYPATALVSGADGSGAVRINAAVQSFGADGITTETSGGKITLIAGNNTKGGTNGGGFELNADVNAGAGGIDVALSTQATGQLSFFIGSAGQAQFTTSDTGQLKSTAQLKIGQATTAGSDGLGPTGLNDQITIKVDQLAIGTSAGGPVTLASTAGTSLVLTSGDGGILVDRPLSTDQATTITTTGALTINSPLTTNGEPLTIVADSISGAGNISGTGTITCSGTGCPGGTVVTWDGGGGDLSWLTPANWNLNVLPTNLDDVQIPSTFSSSTISISGAAVAKSLIADAPVSISGIGILSLVNASQFTRNLTLTGTGSLSSVGPVAVNGSSGILTWNGGTMTSGGSFTLGVGSVGTLSGTLTLDRVFQNSGTLTLSGVVGLSGTGSLTNSAALIAAASTSNTIGVALTNPSNSLIQVLGSLTVSNFPTNAGEISIGNGGTFSTGGAALTNSGSSSIAISGGNYSTTVGNTVTTDGSGNLAVSGALDAGAITLLAGGSGGVTLNSGSTVTASGIGDSLVIKGARFTNNAGSGALNPGAGRFLVWSTNANPFDVGSPDDRGSLAFNFKQYGATYGSSTVLGTGNGFLYTLAPTIAPVLQGAVTKTYDGFVAATLAAGNYKTSGIGEVDLDTVVLSNPATTGSYASAHAGSGILVTAASASSITSATNGGATVYGYQVSSSPASGLVGTINQVQLTAAAAITGANKTYDGFVVATGSTIAGSASGAVTGDTVTVNASGYTLAFDNPHAGARTINASGGSVALNTVGGTNVGDGVSGRVQGLVGDYVLNTTTPTVAGVGATIDQVVLTAAAAITGANKTYDGFVVATGSTIAGSASGAVTGDTVTVNASGYTLAFDNPHAGARTINASGGSVALNTVGGTNVGDGVSGRVQGLVGDYVLNTTTPTVAGVGATIDQVVLTAAAAITGANKTYDGFVVATGSTIAGSASGAVTGDTVTVNASGYTLAFDNPHAGARTINASGGSVALNTVGGTNVGDGVSGRVQGLVGDYVLNTTTPTVAGVGATIDQVVLTAAAAITGANKTYDGFVVATGSTIAGSASGAVTGDTVTVNASGYTLAFDNPHAGARTINASGGSVALNTVGGTNVGDGVSGRVQGLVGDYVLNTTTPTVAGVGATIDQVVLTAAAAITGANKTYDGFVVATGSTIAGSASGAVTGDTVTVNASGYTLAFDNPHAGARTINASGGSVALNTVGGTNVGDGVSGRVQGLVGDYVLNTTTPTVAGVGATIDQVVLTAAAAITGANKTYDGFVVATGSTIAGSASGAVTGDTVTVNASGYTLAFDNPHAGARTINASGGSVALNTVGGTNVGDGVSGRVQGLVGDYVLNTTTPTVAGVGATIDQVVLTAAAAITGANKTYDGFVVATGSTIAGSASGAVTGDTVTVNASGYTLAFDNPHAGARTINASGGSVALNTVGGTNVGDGVSGRVQGLVGDYVLNTTTPTVAGVGATIDQVVLTAAAAITGANKTYDGFVVATGSTIAGSASGAVTGDTVTVNASGYTLAFDNPHAGARTINASGGSVALNTVGGTNVGDGVSGRVQGLVGDYVLNTTTPTVAGVGATIDQVVLTAAAAITGANKTYDGFVVATGSTIAGSASGAVTGDTVTVNASGYTLAFDNPHAGARTINASGGSVALNTVGGTNVGDGVSGRVQGLVGDYVLNTTTPTVAGVGATIDQALLTVTANSTAKTYGQTVTFNGTEFTSAGLVNSETIGSVALTSAGEPATANVAGSPYAIVPSAAGGGTFTASDYAITYANGVLTVNPALINLTLSRTYDGGTNFGAGLIGALIGVNGETLSGGSGTGTVASPNVVAGTQTLSLGGLLLGNGTGLATNYTLVGGTHTGTITPATLTGTIANQTKTYGADDPALAGIGITLGGVIGSDASNLAATLSGLTRTSGENVASYGITSGTFAITGGAAGNYNAPTFIGSPVLVITPASLTAGISNQVKTYGINDPALSTIGVTLGGLVNRTVSTWNGTVALNDTGSVAATLAGLARTSGENVGSYGITGGTLNALTGSAAGNYTGASLNVAGSTLTINPVPLTAGIPDQTKTYASNDPAVGTIPVTLGGAVNASVTDWNGIVTTINDTVALAPTLTDLTRVPGESVGSYNITGGTLTLNGAAASNYSTPSLIVSGITLDIVPPPPNAVVSPTVTTWDGTAPVDINFIWTAGASGTWTTGSSWDKGFAPVNGAVVTIPDIGAAGVTHTITYSGGITNVRSLTSSEALTVAGGSLNLGTTSADVSTLPQVTLSGGALGGAGTVNVATMNILAGGILNGTGTIIGNVNNSGGTVAPGVSPGTLTINGNYVQGPGGTLTVEIGGTAAGTQYDQLVVTGNAALDGTLNVALINGFVPGSGNSFTVVQGGTVSGVFATTNFPAAQSMTTTYLASNVDVLANASQPPLQLPPSAPAPPLVEQLPGLPESGSGTGLNVVTVVNPDTGQREILDGFAGQNIVTTVNPETGERQILDGVVGQNIVTTVNPQTGEREIVGVNAGDSKSGGKIGVCK